MNDFFMPRMTPSRAMLKSRQESPSPCLRSLWDSNDSYVKLDTLTLHCTPLMVASNSRINIIAHFGLRFYRPPWSLWTGWCVEIWRSRHIWRIYRIVKRWWICLQETQLDSLWIDGADDLIWRWRGHLVVCIIAVAGATDVLLLWWLLHIWQLKHVLS